MILEWIYESFPFEVFPSSPFCEIEVGSLFLAGDKVYKLLGRDILKAKLIRWNWWTKFWWRNYKG